MPRAYADIVGNFRRGEAGSYARGGDYDRAARTVANDPALAESYASMGERQRTRQREETMQGANDSYASALNSGDYEGAQTIASKVGNVEAMSGARAYGQQFSEQQRLQVLRGAQQGLAELEAIEANNGQGWEAYRDRARQALAQGGQNLPPELRSFAESLPDAWSPNVTGAARTLTQRILDSLLSPEDLARQQSRTGERRYTPASGGILDTYTGSVAPNPQYVRGGAADQGPPAPPAGYRIVQ